MHGGKCPLGPCNQPGKNCGLRLLLKEILRALRMILCLLWRILSLGKSMGFGVDDDDVGDLVELQDLQRKQQEMAAEELFSEKEELREDIHT